MGKGISHGFIWLHRFSMSKKLLDEGWEVVGVDNLNSYYDKNLKVSVSLQFEKVFHINPLKIRMAEKHLEKHEPSLSYTLQLGRC